MKKCKFCGKEMADEMDFCLYCMKKQYEEKKIEIKPPKYFYFSHNPIIFSLQLIISLAILVFGILFIVMFFSAVVSGFLEGINEQTALIIKNFVL